MMINIDTLLIIILAVLFIYGFAKGLISIIIPIAAVIVSFIIAPLIYNHMSKYFDHSIILKIISLIVTYSVIRIILSKVEKSIKDILKIIYLSWLDRIIGAAIVLFAACIIIYFLSSIIAYYFPEYFNYIEKSKVINLIFELFKNNYISDFINNTDIL
ncbi:CvpA family protein [Brachyspira innocens]|uniref:CvpA family protein n=1 Tax=Brachyspira innocens TaxID=13264 RepID=UPI0026EEC3B2|nr:CvpA family protein [Brachyspira innocens]